MKAPNPLGIVRAIRRVLVALRDGVDGRLHPSRLRRARARLADLRPQSVLFICLGNVCRSPYAERAFSAQVGSRSQAASASAGFIGPDRSPPEAALEAATARGIGHEDHRSKLVTPELIADAEAIFIFDRYNMRDVRSKTPADHSRVFWLGDLDPTWTGKRAIVDPWGKPASDFEETFERIDRCLASLVGTITDPGANS